MPININGEKYLSYREQVGKNKEDIENIEKEISELGILTVLTKVVTNSFTTTGTILEVILVTETEIIPVYLAGDTIEADGIVTEEGSTITSATITNQSVTVTDCTALVYYQE